MFELPRGRAVFQKQWYRFGGLTCLGTWLNQDRLESDRYWKSRSSQQLPVPLSCPGMLNHSVLFLDRCTAILRAPSFNIAPHQVSLGS
jgi:hypothetical protein